MKSIKKEKNTVKEKIGRKAEENLFGRKREQ
jgi:hypothetical protein